MNTCATTIQSDMCNVAGTQNSNVHFLFPDYYNLILGPGVLLISLRTLPPIFFFFFFNKTGFIFKLNLIRKTYF